MNNPDELAGLTEDVADAIAALDESTAPITHAGRQWYATIRAELLRLHGESIGNREDADFWKEKCRFVNASAESLIRERDEAQAELAALKRRIAESQVCGVVAVGGGGASLSHEPYDSLIGKRVALLPIGGEEG